MSAVFVVKTTRKHRENPQALQIPTSTRLLWGQWHVRENVVVIVHNVHPSGQWACSRWRWVQIDSFGRKAEPSRQNTKRIQTRDTLVCGRTPFSGFSSERHFSRIPRYIFMPVEHRCTKSRCKVGSRSIIFCFTGFCAGRGKEHGGARVIFARENKVAHLLAARNVGKWAACFSRGRSHFRNNLKREEQPRSFDVAVSFKIEDRDTVELSSV